MIDCDETRETLRHALVQRFGVVAGQVKMVRAPYRICPLGAHIDHQHGPVTAMAIDRGIWLAFAPCKSRDVRMVSYDFPGEVAFPLDAVPPPVDGDWGNFPRGAVRAMQQDHRLQWGMVAISAGRLDGGGLSSSAAIGVACLLALEHINNLSLTANEKIALHSDIENGYLGLRIGILDQAAILLSRRHHLTLIDCATADHTLHVMPPQMPDFHILIAFSGLKQSLTSTGYNQRVDECRRAALTLLQAAGRSHAPPILGQVSPEEFQQYQDRLDPVCARRAEHFFSEVARVRDGIQAWHQGDLIRFGQLMSESGWSSIRNYECGAPPLIDLFELLLNTPGVLGARFSGAGFRGCCVALVEAAAADDARLLVQERYGRAHPKLSKNADAFLCTSADGATVVT